MDDIPEVLRDHPSSGKVKRQANIARRPTNSSVTTRSRKKNSSVYLGGGLLLLGIVSLSAIFLFWRNDSPSPLTSDRSTQSSETASQPKNNSNSPVSQPDSKPSSTKDADENTDNLLGHLPYPEASRSQLKAISSDGRFLLRQAAADKFTQMQSAARQDGVILTPISAFRSIEDQNEVFFRLKEERAQGATKRAEVSAPPGYSEHHTGYAIDIGDGKVPATNLSTNFAKTAAFRWLEKNAARYNFELSFPQNNLQGVSYEPWHWRFVGDRDSLETFYKAKNLKKPIQKN